MSVVRFSKLAMIVALLSATTASAKTVYVSKAGNDANNGLTWALAKQTVQAGLNTAVSGDQVWVAAGTYVGRITLKSGVALYGGFVGNETALSQRNCVINKTILDGNLAGSVVTSPPSATATTRLDGFMITHGTGTLSGSSRYGGGVYCSSVSSPTIANNTISGNSALFGGGICCVASSSPTITNNLITGNDGGGIYCSDSSEPMIASNTITRNRSTLGGGVCSNFSSPKLVSNMISGNAAVDYGGGIYCVGGYLAIRNNTIAANAATSGGGMYCSNSSSLTIANTIVAFNSSGIHVFGSITPSLRYNCTFGNREYNYSGVNDPTGTNGNVSADPRLASLTYGNMHVQPDSPCLSAGDIFAAEPNWPDVDGQSRFLGSGIEIGADESDGTVWPDGPYLIVRVSPNGDDAMDGSSWATAKRTVQAGINATAPLGGEVWVQGGTYYERITLHAFAYIYGGFAGTESTRNLRDWVSNATVLDGQQSGSVVSVLAGERASRIDGFTIRNGSGTLSNTSLYGGGVYCHHSSPTIANNTIAANTASYGGGIFCYSCVSPIVLNNTISGNRASKLGGGIDCGFSAMMMTNNRIGGNSASGGGGVYCESSSMTMTNNTIAGNSASVGGGIHCSSSSPIIADNTITNNIASSVIKAGGGIYSYYSSPTIASSIIASNTSGIYKTGSGTLSFGYNCVFGNTAYNYSGMADRTGMDGNISAEPLFVRPAAPGPDGQWGTTDDDYGDLRLQAGSPCIDAGDNAAVPADVLDLDGDGNVTEPMPFDLTGNPRFVDMPFVPDTGLGTPPIVDMGAYEFVVEPSPDLDGDGDIDAEDFDRFLMAFGHSAGQTGYNMTADLDMDGVVTFVDYQQWLQAYRAANNTPQAPAPLWVLGDFGLDGHVDVLDLEHFEACATGAGVPQTNEECRNADLDRDGDVDQSDFGSLQRCFSGSGMVDLGCKY